MKGTELMKPTECMAPTESDRLIRVLDDGFVRLVDHMGSDQAIVQAARVSYGAGTKTARDDRGLIRYLMRHRHTTPFEMCVVKFLLRVPMDCWRQFVRHRTASINETSTRYSVAIDSAQQTGAECWHLQSSLNRQGSNGSLSDWPDGHACHGRGTDSATPGQYLSNREAELHRLAREVYEERLAFGVAREQARKDLPLSTYTEAYWKMDLHNLFHYLGLRLDHHAQWEIRQYANAIFSLIKPLFPLACEAFEDYRLGALYLSRLDREVIGGLLGGGAFETLCADYGLSDREQRELKEKLNSLGLERPEQSHAE